LDPLRSQHAHARSLILDLGKCAQSATCPFTARALKLSWHVYALAGLPPLLYFTSHHHTRVKALPQTSPLVSLFLHIVSLRLLQILSMNALGAFVWTTGRINGWARG
jgi:hypothetical protein